MDSNILVIEPDTTYSQIVSNILKKSKYGFDIISDQSLLEKTLSQENSYQIALLDIDSMESEQFISSINLLVHKHNLKTILMTEQDIGKYLALLIEHDITQLLNKPIKSTELLNIIDKLIYFEQKNIFDIKNHLKNIKNLKKIKITKSDQTRRVVKIIFKYMKRWGFNFKMEFEMDLVWQELLVNAVYHSHGFTEEKKQQVQIELSDSKYVLVTFACNENQFGISVRDFQGTLERKQILNSFNSAFEEQKLISQASKEGRDVTEFVLDHGRGLDIIRRMSGEYYFIIESGKSTEVIVIYDGLFENDGTYSNISIFEF